MIKPNSKKTRKPQQRYCIIPNNISSKIVINKWEKAQGIHTIQISAVGIFIKIGTL